MSKKIIFIIESLGGGGSQSVVSTLITEWKKRGFDITLTTFKPKKFDRFSLTNKVNRVIIQNEPKSRFIFYRIYNNILFILKLRNFLKKNPCDVIISFITSTNLLVLIASIGLKKKIVVSERNDISYQTITNFKRFLRFIFYRYAYLVSSNIKNSLIEMEKYVNKNKLIYLPNPIRFTRNSRDIKKKKKIILSIGRLNKQKGYDILIMAFNEFINKPSFNNWKLYILGEGPEKKKLEKIIERLNLSNSVYLLGYQDPLKFFNIAKIYVQSSIFEGMPNSVLEAMMCRVPIILNTRIRGIRHLAKNNLSCLYFDNNENDLCKKISYLAKNPQKRKLLSKNAFQAINKLNVETVTNIWLRKLNL